MAEQLRRSVRRRKVGVVTNIKHIEKDLDRVLSVCMNIGNQIAKLQLRLEVNEVLASGYMMQLNVDKYVNKDVEATYTNPPQRTTQVYDTSGLFEDVSPDDFVASVKVQRGQAEKFIDPKVLSKHSTANTSELKPPTLKYKKV